MPNNFQNFQEDYHYIPPPIYPSYDVYEQQNNKIEESEQYNETLREIEQTLATLSMRLQKIEDIQEEEYRLEQENKNLTPPLEEVRLEKEPNVEYLTKSIEVEVQLPPYQKPHFIPPPPPFPLKEMRPVTHLCGESQAIKLKIKQDFNNPLEEDLMLGLLFGETNSCKGSIENFSVNVEQKSNSLTPPLEEFRL